MKLRKVSLGLVLATALASVASAQTAPTFDYTTYSTILETGGAKVAACAALLGGIAAGVMVWKKIAKYFNKAG